MSGKKSKELREQIKKMGNYGKADIKEMVKPFKKEYVPFKYNEKVDKSQP